MNNNSITNAYGISFITLSIMSLFAITSTIRLSTENNSDEQFFLNISNYAVGENAQSAKNKHMLKIHKDRFSLDMNQLSRIMKILLEKNSLGKTSLSLEAKINYTRLLRYLKLLEEKQFVESVIEDGRVNVKLSRMGRDFAIIFSTL